MSALHLGRSREQFRGPRLLVAEVMRSLTQLVETPASGPPSARQPTDKTAGTSAREINIMETKYLHLCILATLLAFPVFRDPGPGAND